VGEEMIDEYEAGTTALHEACEAGHLEVIQTLLDANPTENSSYIKHDGHQSPNSLHLATEMTKVPWLRYYCNNPI